MREIQWLIGIERDVMQFMVSSAENCAWYTYEVSQYEKSKSIFTCCQGVEEVEECPSHDDDVIAVEPDALQHCPVTHACGRRKEHEPTVMYALNCTLKLFLVNAYMISFVPLNTFADTRGTVDIIMSLIFIFFMTLCTHHGGEHFPIRHSRRHWVSTRQHVI